MAEAVDSTEVQQPAAAGDEDDRKLFVGGLPQDASQVFQFPQSPIWTATSLWQSSGSGLDPDVSIGSIDPRHGFSKAKQNTKRGEK
jgi:hypothetical protein